MKDSTKNGFTLVELSIALVIIGLLIGGILVGQSMIASAKINNLVSTIQLFDAAVSSFKTKFNGLPGDARAFGGNNNGRIEGENALNPSFSGGIANFWANLQASGFKYNGKTFTPTVSGNINQGNDNTPILPFTVDADVIVFNRNDSSGKDVMLYHFFNASNIGAGNNLLDAMGDEGSAPTEMAFAIDKKLDDGRPISGNVQGANSSAFNRNAGDDGRCSDYSETNAVQDPELVRYLVGDGPADYPHACVLMLVVLGQ